MFNRRAPYGLNDPRPQFSLTNPAFRRTDADTAFWVLSQGSTFYTQPVDDPLYLAQSTLSPITLSMTIPVDAYYASNPL